MFFEEPYYFVPSMKPSDKKRVEGELSAAARAEGVSDQGMRWYPVTRKARNWRYAEEFGKIKNPQLYVEEDTGAWSLDFRVDKPLSKAAVSALWSKGIRIRRYAY